LGQLNNQFNYVRINGKLLDRTPFTKFKYKLIADVMRTLVLDALDLYLPPFAAMNKSILAVTALIPYELDLKLGTEIKREGQPFANRIEVLYWKRQQLSYVTKYGTHRPQAFEFYLLPYDRYSWICILVVICTLPFLFLGQAQSLCLFTSVLLVNLATLLRTSPHITARLIGGKFKVLSQLTVGIWLLLLVILVEAYVGIIVGFLVVIPSWTASWPLLLDLNRFVVIHELKEHELKSAGLVNESHLTNFIGDITLCKTYRKKKVECGWNDVDGAGEYCKEVEEKWISYGGADIH